MHSKGCLSVRLQRIGGTYRDISAQGADEHKQWQSFHLSADSCNENVTSVRNNIVGENVLGEMTDFARKYSLKQTSDL